MLYAFLILIALLLIINLIYTVKAAGNNNSSVLAKLDTLPPEMQSIESSVKKEIALNRRKTNDNAAYSCKELADSIPTQFPLKIIIKSF